MGITWTTRVPTANGAHPLGGVRLLPTAGGTRVAAAGVAAAGVAAAGVAAPGEATPTTLLPAQPSTSEREVIYFRGKLTCRLAPLPLTLPSGESVVCAPLS